MGRLITQNGKLKATLIIFLLFTSSSLYPELLVKKGLIDLRNFTWNKPIYLDGWWGFYYNVFYTREDIKSKKLQDVSYIYVPSSWSGKKISNTKIPETGYATYHCKVLLGEKAPKTISILIPKVDSSYALYINDILITNAGVIGKTPEESIPFWKQTIIDFPVTGSEIDIIFHISNFYYAQAGITKSIVLGTKDLVLQQYVQSAIIKFFIFGALLIIALYHLFIFMFKLHDKKTLYFSLFSFSMALLSIIFGEFHIMLIFPHLSYALLVKITYLTMSLGLTFFALFFKELYPEDYPNQLFTLSIFIGTVYTLLILILPVYIFSTLLMPFLIIISGFGIITLLTFINAIRNKRQDASLFFAAFIIYSLTIINDMLHFNHIINTTYMVPYGFFMFIILQSFVLAKQNARLYVQLQQLFKEKLKLESLTINLKNIAYIDPLTGIPNRRRFEEYLNIEWARAIRNNTPISIILLDIDYFKKFNDKFGHVKGDMALKQVAKTIQSCIYRPADMVARYGGEEFIVILPETEIIGAYRIAERMRKAVLNCKIPAAYTLAPKFLSISLGCSTAYPKYNSNPNDLINSADKKLYRAKKLGRNYTEK